MEKVTVDRSCGHPGGMGSRDADTLNSGLYRWMRSVTAETRLL